MLIVLSHFTHRDDGLERGLAPGVELYTQPHATAAQNPVPPEIRARADAIIHYSANTAPDGTPADWPACRALLRSGVGYDRIDLKAWGSRGVPVFNVPDYGTSEVADHALALMLALTRGTATYHEALRADPQAGWRFDLPPAVRRLRGATFGVVGLGRIGLAAAQRARAFGMDIAFFDPFTPSGFEIAVGARRCETLAELMGLADVLSIHAPASEETRGLVDAAAFAAAKPGMVLVNTARGAIVDLDALTAALRDGRVAAAGLDVLPVEPADRTHPLFAAWLAREPWLEGRLTLSPHAAFYSPDSLVDMRGRGMETVLRHLRTGSLRNCVNEHVLEPAARAGQKGR